MPSTIPYDPSLILGNIVQQEVLDNVKQIADLQAPADAAQANLNSLISLKRSVDMTIQEIVDMGISVDDLISESAQIGQDVQKAAIDYGKARVASQKAIQPLMAKISMVSDSVESPIDYYRSLLKTLPIASDSMQMNVQYFSNDTNDQTSSNHASAISSFVKESLSDFAEGQSTQVSASVQTQVNSQVSRHSIAGTVVICIACTHKNAQVFAPFILDVDKAVRVWNVLFKDSMIKTNDPASISKIVAVSETREEKSFNILSGATYGSSFVGMVHVLDTTDTTSSQDMEALASNLQATFDVGGWFSTETGGFGVASSFSDSAKNLLSTQNVQSHCSLVTMGIIPSIKSSQVDIAVQGFNKDDFNPQKQMDQLAALQNAAGDANNEATTVASAAGGARTGQQMIALKNATIKATLSSLADIDSGNNNIINTNSMMEAMDDYINKCLDGGNNMGVPINYYLKPITQSMIARAWLAKYYPNRFNQAGSADDSSNSGGGGATPGSSANPASGDGTTPTT